MAKRLSNPLALAVLVLLFERPMHPYEMASTLKERHKEDSIKLRYGSLYTVIRTLQQAGFIAPTGTQREGRRPERTVFALTAAGRVEMRDWLRELLAKPSKEFPRFEAALSLMPALAPEEVRQLLEDRRVRLDLLLEQRTQGLEAARAEKLPRLFLIESEYALALLRAERDFVSALAGDIRDGSLEGVALWQQIHAALADGRDPAQLLSDSSKTEDPAAAPSRRQRNA